METHGEGLKTVSEFEIGAGQRIPIALHYRPSHEPMRPAIGEQALATDAGPMAGLVERCSYRGRWRGGAALVGHAEGADLSPTGGIVAAPTTSPPEHLGGVRNFDYRYCWLRDATFTLNALLLTGYTDEAVAWCGWRLRAVAGSPQDLQMIYSVTGERRLEEMELGWLPGYAGSTPVRIGNVATRQFQLDVYGEVMDTLHLARAAGLQPEPHAWEIQRALLDFLSANWGQPDEGIWEVRGPRRQFTHSKVMAWVAFDRAIKDVERFGLDGPVDAWRRTRDAIHSQVCREGFSARRNSFVQYYGSEEVDASLLLIPGWPAQARAIVSRARGGWRRGGLLALVAVLGLAGTASAQNPTGWTPGEGAFLPCTFWLADCLALTGHREEAEALFENLLALRNDVGLLSEEFDPRARRMLGNFPQALSHMALINTAHLLALPPEKAERSAARHERLGAVATTA